jgi:hypothetical protein
LDFKTSNYYRHWTISKNIFLFEKQKIIFNFFFIKEQSQSILADITDDYLTNRNHFYRYDLQLYTQVTCAYTNDHLIYALYNEIETIILRFDNQDNLSKLNKIKNKFLFDIFFVNKDSPQQLIFPKRQPTGLFNFLWNPK